MLTPDDLAGRLEIQVSDQHADFFVRNLAAVRVTQDLRPVGPVYGAMVPVNREMLHDPATLDLVIEGMAIEYLRPWARPDRFAFPVALFPTLDRFGRRLARIGQTTHDKLRRVAVWCASHDERRTTDAL